MVKISFPWLDEKPRRSGLFLFSLALAGLLWLPQPALADPEPQPALFDIRLSYSSWDLGGGSGYIDGFDGEICPPWPWPWRWRWPWPPRFDLRVSYYDVKENGLDRAIPLELGLLFPLSQSSRVTPYFGAGLGYYLLESDSPAIDDELGAYGALGVDIHLADRWGLTLEGGYREVNGDLDLGGPAFKAGIGFSFN